jgi:carboxylate-amine ligase
VRQVGVEEELLVVDGADGRPASGFRYLAAEGERRSTEPPQHELKQEQVEIASAPSDDVVTVVADLQARRIELGAVAAGGGLAVAASGTSPVGGPVHTTPDERYLRMRGRFGLLERQQLSCGMHVHVSIGSPTEGVEVLDRLRPWLPVLLALSANSPYWGGEDTGYASYRSVVWGQWPTSGPTELFGDHQTYRAVVDGLVASGTILDEGMVYFDARLSRNYPTVEIRVADVCTDLGDAATVAALARGLVESAASDARSDRPVPPVRIEALRVASWGAARFGLSGEVFDTMAGRPRAAADAVDRTVDYVRKALVDAGDLELVETGVARLLARGTGADGQRAAYRRAVAESSPGPAGPDAAAMPSDAAWAEGRTADAGPDPRVHPEALTAVILDVARRTVAAPSG